MRDSRSSGSGSRCARGSQQGQRGDIGDMMSRDGTGCCQANPSVRSGANVRQECETAATSDRSVWMLTGDFHPGTGGGELQAQNISRELIRRGWLVSVITRRHGFEHLRGAARYEVVDTIPVHRLYARGGGKVAALLYVAGGVWFLLRHRRRRIYHAHGEGAPAWLAVIAR